MGKNNTADFNSAFDKYVENQIRVTTGIIKHERNYSDKDSLISYKLYFDNFEIELNYKDVSDSNGYCFLESVNSTMTSKEHLYAVFHFPFSDLKYSIYDVHNAVLDNNFKTYEFHFLRNEQAMKSAIEAIFEFILRHYHELNNPSPEFIKRLDDVFEYDIKLVSKKLTREKLLKKPDKYYDSLAFEMYQHSICNAEYFNDFIVKGKRTQLEKMLAKKSAKGKLLTYEQRFMDYLIAHDFNYSKPDIIEQVKDTNKLSVRVTVYESICTLISLFIVLFADFLLWKCVNDKVFSTYTVLTFTSAEEGLFFLIFQVLAMQLIVRKPVEMLFFKNKGIDEAYNRATKKTFTILAVISIFVLSGTFIYGYIADHKGVAINDNGIYYCDKIGDVKHYNWDDNSIEFFIIEGYYEDYDSGEYFGNNDDKTVLIVTDGDYENYTMSDCFSDDDDVTFNDVQALLERHRDVKHFKALCDYDKEYII